MNNEDPVANASEGVSYFNLINGWHQLVEGVIKTGFPNDTAKVLSD